MLDSLLLLYYIIYTAAMPCRKNAEISVMNISETSEDVQVDQGKEAKPASTA